MDGDGGLEMAVSARLTPAQGRKFAFTLGIALLVLGAFSLWRGHTIVPYVLLAPGAVLEGRIQSGDVALMGFL